MFGASACSGGLVGTAPAATVDGTDISQEKVISATEATQAFYEYSLEQGQDASGSLTELIASLDGTGSDSVGTEGAARVLTDMIVDEVIRQELEAHDALPTKADHEEARRQLEEQAGGAEALAKFPAAYIDLYLDGLVVNQAYLKLLAAEADEDVVPLTAEEREAAMRELYEQVSTASPLCLNAIQAATEADAAEARQRVDAGEDFVAVAQDLAPEGSTIPDEGAVACLGFEGAQAAFDQDFSTAAVGDVIGPVTYNDQQSGQTIYLVLRVEGLEGQTYEELLPRLEEQVPAEPAPTDPDSLDATEPLSKLLKAAAIDVNAIFGRWSPAQQAVVPPKVPGAPVTTTVPALPGS